MLRKAKYEFQNAKVRRFEASINNDYSQFKKRKKQPCVKNCREFFRENHQLISPTSATRHFPFAYKTLMSKPQKCSVCWAACVKYYSTDVVWGGGGGGWSVHVKTTKRYLSFESSLRECYTVLRLCLHACTLCVCTPRVDMHVYVMQYFVCAFMHGICLLREYS